jgi:HWE histidine kinase
LWGRTPARGDDSERFCGSIRMFRPDGSFLSHDQCPMAWVVLGKVSEVNDEEVIVERPDGSRVTAIVNIRPLKNDRGEVTGAINCAYDITERKHVEEHQRFLMGELAHRGGNLLAVIQSIVARTLIGAKPLAENATHLRCASRRLHAVNRR